MKSWIVIFFVLTGSRLSRCNFGCPAPRSPENGLSFIFQSGRLVKYSCHPGFTLIGHAQAECLNHQWNQAVPVCVAGSNRSSTPGSVGTNASSAAVRPLFEWDSSNQKNQQMYGEGARRLPLINGIWNQTRSRNLDNRTRDSLVNQEINIASVRHRQQQEVRRSRLYDAPSEWRRQQLAEARRRPDTLYAQSRSASSYHRGRYDHVSQEVTTTTSTPRPVNRRRDVTASPVRTIGMNDRDLSELRLRQIEEVQRSRMGGHHQTNADKSGIVDNYRRSQYNYYQTLHGTADPNHVVGPPVTFVRRPIYSNELPSLFSEEKAGQVEQIFRNYFPPDNRRPVYAVGPPLIGGTSTPPTTPRRPEITTPRRPLPPSTPKRPSRTTPPPRRQPLSPSVEIPRAPASSEKAAQAEDTLLDQYLRAEHMRRILELERAGGTGRRAAVSTEDEMRQRIDVLSNMVPGVDSDWLNRLSPELQLRYLQEVLVSRGKEARDGRAAEEFLRRHS